MLIVIRIGIIQLLYSVMCWWDNHSWRASYDPSNLRLDELKVC